MRAISVWLATMAVAADGRAADPPKLDAKAAEAALKKLQDATAPSGTVPATSSGRPSPT